MIAERDDGTGNWLRYYIYSPGGTLLYMIDASDGNSVRYYHFDQTGNTIFLTDTAGIVTDEYAYSFYGEVLARTGTSEQIFTYGGKYGVIRLTDRYYLMRKRCYDSLTGRFLSRDGAWPQISDALASNPYPYASGNPISYHDPMGQDNRNAVEVIWDTGNWIYDNIGTGPVELTVRLVLDPDFWGAEAEAPTMGPLTEEQQAIEDHWAERRRIARERIGEGVEQFRQDLAVYRQAVENYERLSGETVEPPSWLDSRLAGLNNIRSTRNLPTLESDAQNLRQLALSYQISSYQMELNSEVDAFLGRLTGSLVSSYENTMNNIDEFFDQRAYDAYMSNAEVMYNEDAEHLLKFNGQFGN